MSLLSMTSRNIYLIKRITKLRNLPLVNQTKNWQITSVCNYAERVYTKKVFQPALGDNEAVEIKEQIVVDKKKTESDLYLEKRKEMNLNKKKVRKLTKIDKMILVFIGKFKNIKDVPDQLTFKTLEKRKELDGEIKHLMLGSVFKYGYFFEYASFFLTFSILGYALYNYKKKSKPQEVESASTTVEKNS